MSNSNSNGLMFSGHDYSNSEIHLVIALRDHTALRRILSTLPKPPPSASIKTVEESIQAEESAEKASQVIDYRNVPGRETPLALAVRIGDIEAVDILMQAGADASLTNAEGWTPLQESVCKGDQNIAAVILRYYQIIAWSKYTRRLPSLSFTMHKMRDFYMEIHWKFESSVIPFISRIAPSDTYRIWKKGSSLRADMTLAGFEGLRIKRRRQSLLFFGDGIPDENIPPGRLIILKHEKKEKFDALEGADKQLSEAEMAKDVKFLFQTDVYKGGIDVSNAKICPVVSWRGYERSEVVNGYKTVLYEMRNVNLRVKSRKVPGAITEEELFSRDRRGREEGEGRREKGFFLGEKDELDSILTEEEKKQLENALEKQRRGEERTDSEESGDGEGEGEGVEEERFLNLDDKEERRLGDKKDEKDEKSDGDEDDLFMKDDVSNETNEVEMEKKNKGKSGWLWGKKKERKKEEDEVENEFSKEKTKSKKVSSSRSSSSTELSIEDGEREKEKEKEKGKEKSSNEWKKGLKPMLWLTHDFPLQMNELMPLLDLLAKKVKAVRRLQELLLTKMPAGTVPIKVAIPIVPTIRAIVTFSKFEEMRPWKEEENEEEEDFSTPVGSPTREEGEKASKSTWVSWLKGGKQASSSNENGELEQAMDSDLMLVEGYDQPVFNPFEIPEDYKWIDVQERKRREREKRKQKKVKLEKNKSKQQKS